MISKTLQLWHTSPTPSLDKTTHRSPQDSHSPCASIWISLRQVVPSQFAPQPQRRHASLCTPSSATIQRMLSRAVDSFATRPALILQFSGHLWQQLHAPFFLQTLLKAIVRGPRTHEVAMLPYELVHSTIFGACVASSSVPPSLICRKFFQGRDMCWIIEIKRVRIFPRRSDKMIETLKRE